VGASEREASLLAATAIIKEIEQKLRHFAFMASGTANVYSGMMDNFRLKRKQAQAFAEVGWYRDRIASYMAECRRAEGMIAGLATPNEAIGPLKFLEGRLYSLIGKWREARTCYEIALANGMPEVMTRYFLAHTYDFDGGEAALAIQHLERAIEIADPYGKMEGECAKQIDIISNPGNTGSSSDPAAHTGGQSMGGDEELRRKMERAAAEALRDNWPETQRLCTEILKAMPTSLALDAMARTQRSLALAFKGYKEADRASLNEALDEARRAVQVFQKTNEPAKSVALAHRAIGMSISFMIAQSVIHADEWPTLFPEAVAALEKAIQLDPEDKEARRQLGILNSAREVAKMHGAKAGGKCFIATAACGTPWASEVLVLSAFRDDSLSRSRIGRAFTRLYYDVSPPFASLIARSIFLRRAAMALIVKPAVHVVQKVGNTKCLPQLGSLKMNHPGERRVER